VKRFAFRKLVQAVFLLLTVSVITFGMLSTAGGDALSALRENPQVSQETIDRLAAVYSFDKPATTRYFTWLGGLLRGDLGESFLYKTPVLGLLLWRFGNTAILAIAGLLIALVIAMPSAYLVVRTRSRWLDGLVDVVVSLTASVPRMVASLLALLILISISGNSFAGTESFAALFLGALVIALPVIAVLLAQAKGELARSVDLAFVQYARSKGLSERAVILRHAFREALNPLLTLGGLSIGTMVSGSVVVETILGWPGIGSLLVAAVKGRDVSLVMGIVVVTSVIVWLANTVAEILQMFNDPRLRSAEASTGV
jgi:peptide/nickel transport system permease protein